MSLIIPEQRTLPIDAFLWKLLTVEASFCGSFSLWKLLFGESFSLWEQHPVRDAGIANFI